ncbi:hypothetical protein EW026_g1507 [Hermanssonia centrifuga]|uniref:FAD-binding domain-containing protein n=1 Tax=Hermanssonia centrifuga TaxID=98765 RepID=A0A4S4KR87_9APHY|nr:hypothetical protein EW026_g1507 [Hermanssonia centrifuga]
MSSTKVIVAGAGIAGPVLSIFLKRNGYDPILCERTEGISDAGLSLCLQPNGLSVLAKIPGLVESLVGGSIEKRVFYSVLPEDKGILGESDIAKQLQEEHGVGIVLGVRRTVFHQALVEAAQKAGVQIKWGHKLVSMDQHDESVTVKFENGAEETASFVIGCDGLHSNTRICLFGDEKADFTGLVQTGGICAIPKSMNAPPSMIDIFGNGTHMISYPINDKQCVWAATRREPEAKETWRAMSIDNAEEFKKSSLYVEWDYGGGEMVKSTGASVIIKYGLYDRPELKRWHKQRVCLLGDAAHPTSPHLGQGANQAFEDIDLLISLLAQYNPIPHSPPTHVLENIFSELEKARIPRSSELVKKARLQGESRVTEGVEACIKRNNTYRDICKDQESVGKFNVGQRQ